MSYIGDIALGQTFDIKFTSRRFSSGSPFTLAGSPVISAYPDNSTTQLTAGITLSVDFDSVTGLNNVHVVATGGNGYASGSNYQLVITAGTVDSVSVIGEVIGQFSIEARSALRPTAVGRTLDVSMTGEAGLDFDNIKSTTTFTLNGLTITNNLLVSGTSTFTGDTIYTGNVSYGNGIFVAGGSQLHALRLSSATAGHGIYATGNTTGAGARFEGGGNGNGFEARAGSGSGAIGFINVGDGSGLDIKGPVNDLGTGGLNAAGVRAAIGLASANLDTQLLPVASMTFTVAGQIDANIRSVNNVPVTGNGQPGTEWGP